MARNIADFLIRRLNSIGSLSAAEETALRQLDATVAVITPRQDIIREREHPKSVTLAISGFLCRYKVVDDGGRQIMSFHIPGDIPDLQSLYLSVLDYNLCSLTETEVAKIPRSSMLEMMSKHQKLAQLLWRDTLIDAAVFREWIVNIGRRSSFSRLSHLLCELVIRMKAVGLTMDHTIRLPITQTDIADALAISTVHANRILQEMRGEGLIKFAKGTLTVLDWDGLQEAGQFDDAYLHVINVQSDL